MKKQLFAVLTALLLVLGPAVGISSAAVASNTVTVPLVLNIPESISLSLSTNSITLSNVQQSANVTLTAGWQILPNAHTSATIYAFFSAMPTLSGGSQPIGSSFFTTQYNGGSTVSCDQGAFPGQGSIGISGRNCGTFSFPNIATDTNDSQAVVLTVAATPAAFNVAVGSYVGGVLNVVFQIV